MTQRPGFLLIQVVAGAVALLVPAVLRAELPQARKKDLASDPAWVKKAALEIDRRVGAQFQRRKVQPLPPADDARWLRRVYLDAVGRIPSYEEAKRFLDDPSEDKRTRLIDELLTSEGYVSTMYNYFCDLLRATSRLGQDGTRSGVPYLRWIRESVAANTPFNRFTHELLTATGGGWEPGKGAVGYFERDRGMPLDNMANTTRIFLGTHIECAQCHDHPYDQWKQKDFYEMAAFTHGMSTGYRDERARFTREKYDGTEELEEDRKKRDIYRWLHDNIYDFGVSGGGDGVINLPMDFKGKGGKPGETVRARSIYPGASNSRRGPIDDARDRFAKWVVSPENPRFTLVICNRMWKRIMGIGLFEPVDRYVEPSRENPEGTVISNPELMTYLQQLMKELDYDLRGFQKVLLSTRTYALGTNPSPVNPGEPYAFHGRAVRRMTAEQVWDSMATLVVPDIDHRKGDVLNPTAVIYGRRLGVSAYEIFQELRDADQAAIVRWVDQLAAKLESGGGGNAMKPEMAVMSSGDGSGAMMMDSSRWEGYSRELLRASELPSPAPPTHFLRKFGQSSREVIEGGSTESDVTQVLSLINGHVEKNIINDSKAVVYRAIDAAATPEEKVKAAFLAVLSRYPTPAELELMAPEAAKGRSGIKNILYALLNSNEFIFIL